MTGGSAKLANVRAGAVWSEIRAKMELRSQQKKSKKYGQATAGRAAGAHKSTATRIRKIIRRVNNNSDQHNNSDQPRFAFLKQNVYRKAQKQERAGRPRVLWRQQWSGSVA